MEFQKVTIHTMEQQYDEKTQDCIMFRRKSTKENPVEESGKYRAILVPSFTLPTASLGEVQAENVFQLAIREAFFSAAGEILKDFCDHDKDAKLVSLELFTFAAIVAKMQERATPQRLNGDMIAAWYDVSETAKDAAKRYGEDDAGKKKQASLKAHYMSLASNNPGIPQNLAVKMISYVSATDTGNSVAKSILQKLETLSKKEVSSDDL